MYKECINRRISWFVSCMSSRFSSPKLTMSEQANTLSADPNFFFTADTHLFTDSVILCPEFNENIAGLDNTFTPAMDDSSGWGKQVLDQQQHYQTDQSRQEQSQRQHTQPQHGQGKTSGQVPDRQVPCTLSPPSLASTAVVSGIQSTSPCDTDWYFPQAPYHTSFTSMVDSGGRCVTSLPYLEQSPPLETRSTPRQRSDLNVAEQ